MPASAFARLPLLLFFFATSIFAYGQSQQIDYRQQLNMPTVLPASPDAASIEKFGNIPVSYATGVPDISIPMYTIKCGSLNWPLSLSYHAGGIRVDEIASGAGLGWSVLAPGVISRSRVGRHDEDSPSEPNYTTVGTSNFDYLYKVLKGTADSEQDIFNFNFNGRSGKFVINQDGSILQIPLSNLKITYVLGGSSSGAASFTIKDENGITYLFDEKENTSAQGYPSEATPTEYTSSWYLTKVEMPDKMNILQFSYASGGQTNENFTTFSHAVGRKYSPYYNGSQMTASMVDQFERSQSSYVVYTGILKLSSVTFPNGSAQFSYDAAARQDVGTNVTNKLSAVTINQVVNSVSTQLKKFTLFQSYFFNNGSNNSRLYRLRLDSLAEFGSGSTASPKKYKFEYNTTPMVPRENYGQDIWGYNNGKSGNKSLLQYENISFHNGSQTLSYNIGDYGDSRAVDTNQMKACMLTAITYPTGGKTTFTFDAHVYNTDQSLASTTEKETQVAGNQVAAAPQTSTTTFTFPANVIETSARVVVDMSKYDFTGVTNPSWVSIRDMTPTPVTVYVKTQTTPSQQLYSDEPISLVPGHSYELKAYVYTSTSNAALTAKIKVRWDSNTTVPDIRKGGGLRIREIKNYSADGVLAGMETYLYDTAVTLTPFANIQRTYSEVIYRLGIGSGLSCVYYTSPTCRVYSSSSVYAMSTAMGSPMLYRRVQKLTTDPVTGTTNGMSEYRYDVYRDEFYPIGGRYVIVPLLSNDWMNGSLLSETHYKLSNGIYSKVKSTEYKYSQFNSTQSYSLQVRSNYIREGCYSLENATSISSDASYGKFPIRSGSKRLREQIDTIYDANQNIVETRTSNEYMSPKYDFPTKTMVVDSKGKYDSTTFKHPPDLSVTGNVYNKMELLNIIAPVVEQKSYSDGAPLSFVKNNYKDYRNEGKVFALDTAQASQLGNSLEMRLKYYDFDTYGNPLSVSKAKDVQVSYIWDYQSAHPVAQVTNAAQTDIAYTSFEADGKGSWSYAGTPFMDASAPTGKRVYNLYNGAVSRSINSAKTYTVSFWSKVQPTLAGAIFQRSGRTLNGYTYYEYKTNASATNVTITGNTFIDELRLYPSNSLMTTNCYDPLVGVTAQCDQNNRIVYYNYDNFGRLFVVRDQDRKILKKICYSYIGQQDNCTVFGNDLKSGSFPKQCIPGQTPSNVPYTVPASTYFALTKEDANAMAQAEVNQNGQAYANQYGTCTAQMYTVTGYMNSKLVDYTVTFTPSSGTGAVYSFTLPARASNIILGNVAGGTYDVKFQASTTPPTANFSVNSLTMTGVLGHTFMSVSILGNATVSAY